MSVSPNGGGGGGGGGGRVKRSASEDDDADCELTAAVAVLRDKQRELDRVNSDLHFYLQKIEQEQQQQQDAAAAEDAVQAVEQLARLKAELTLSLEALLQQHPQLSDHAAAIASGGRREAGASLDRRTAADYPPSPKRWRLDAAAAAAAAAEQSQLQLQEAQLPHNGLLMADQYAGHVLQNDDQRDALHVLAAAEQEHHLALQQSHPEAHLTLIQAVAEANHVAVAHLSQAAAAPTDAQNLLLQQALSDEASLPGIVEYSQISYVAEQPEASSSSSSSSSSGQRNPAARSLLRNQLLLHSERHGHRLTLPPSTALFEPTTPVRSGPLGIDDSEFDAIDVVPASPRPSAAMHQQQLYQEATRYSNYGDYESFESSAATAVTSGSIMLAHARSSSYSTRRTGYIPGNMNGAFFSEVTISTGPTASLQPPELSLGELRTTSEWLNAGRILELAQQHSDMGMMAPPAYAEQGNAGLWL
ncbi:hypothetical protein CAOG_03277 [Capsaspora owczarzaki ATCC 30864]|uniref:hypothetical protein n=1 Tax=Capsaspora owczarzaki (strain ATCC 30864) TaxID=595528 RepID=UPI0001FE262E|nr:hypothetical protein CAOG_03277 [Capsaspora owczarzaki ATCC 30864]|eukprot:XP_004364116.1 hypothetical protein CAOG_03277 [Capsaspora owczarzaki ATCC 30864]